MNLEAFLQTIFNILPEYQRLRPALLEDHYAEAGQPSSECRVLAHYYLEHAATFSDDQRVKLFNAIENAMINGNRELQDAVATCFLENLQNAGCAHDSFVPYLGTESKAFCRAWDEFTGVKTPGL